MRPFIKAIAQVIALVLAFPFAAVALFGRYKGGFVVCSNLLALAPGVAGSYLRVGFYRQTLEWCSPEVFIGFGSFFAHPQARVEEKVGIGAYCVLGMVDLGRNSLLASGVQILSGAQQHYRDSEGRLVQDGGVFTRVTIGPDCWIGAGSMIMANLGEQVTVAAGSVVAKDVNPRSVVAGNPARIVRAGEAAQSVAS